MSLLAAHEVNEVHTQVYSVLFNRNLIRFLGFTESFRARLLAGAGANAIRVCSCVSLCGRECARCSAGEMMEASGPNEMSSD